MNFQINKLETQNLILRKLTMQDLSDYIEFRQNEQLHKFLPTVPKSNSEYQTSLKTRVENYNNLKNPTLTWGIELKSEHKLVGSVTIEDVLSEHKLCEIGWAVNVNYQGKGIATEALTEIISYIFSNSKVNRIQAFIWQGNSASIKLAKKLGFKHEGTDRKARLKNGQFLDVLNFGLLRSEWETNFSYRIATMQDLETIWDKDISRNLGDDRWARWKKQYINYNQTGMATTFVAVNGFEPVGQITVLFSPECSAVKNRPYLCDGKTIANMNAFRIDKQFEGQGHISKLVKLAEAYAKEKGFNTLTIGCEAQETRNLAIYLHFGYTKFVTSLTEDNELILYYEKQL
ncbi:MAG: N-acetyltransferase [Clostridia bacterium]|nr:N-acetyltransferase [Clostridia bacterium]